MKKYGIILFWALAFASCQPLQPESQEPCRLDFKMDRNSWSVYAGEKGLKGASLVLDTNQFILKVYSVSGEKIYDGKYGKRPASLTVSPGAYDVSLLSSEFTAPGYECPQFGDRQTIVALSGESVCVELFCSQLNTGVKLNCTEGFRKQFPGTGLKLSDSSGVLLYRYDEQRTAYFYPGKLQISYETATGDTVLLVKNTVAAQMICFNLSYTSGMYSSFKVVPDTARSWLSEYFNAGYNLPEGAVPVKFAKSLVGLSHVTVYGYIIGGDATTTTLRVGPPFKSRTHFVIASSPRERNRNDCMAVELPTGEIRDALNLVDHPTMIGKVIVITGDIVENYYGFMGLKKFKSYQFPESF